MTKKISLKNDEVEHGLSYDFLNDGNSIKIISSGKKKLISQNVRKYELTKENKQFLLCFIFLYNRTKKPE